MNDEGRWLEYNRLTAARTAYSLGIRAGAEDRQRQPAGLNSLRHRRHRNHPRCLRMSQDLQQKKLKSYCCCFFRRTAT